jgi:hypothetical protein
MEHHIRLRVAPNRKHAAFERKNLTLLITEKNAKCGIEWNYEITEPQPRATQLASPVLTTGQTFNFSPLTRNTHPHPLPPAITYLPLAFFTPRLNSSP